MTFSTLATATLVLLFSCTNNGSDFEAGPTGDCDIVVSNTWPADGATGVYNRHPIEFTLSSPDPTAVVLADFPGTQVTSEDGLTITYIPDDPLETNTTYDVALEYCYATPQIRFTTSTLGEPLNDDLALQDVSWVLDPLAGEYLEGYGLASTMAAVFKRDLMAQVTEEYGSELTMRLGVADNAGQSQDECFRTIEATEIDFSGEPYLEFYTPKMTFGAFNGYLNLYDITLSGTISPNGRTFGGVSYSLIVDVGDLVDIMKVSDADAMCDLAVNLGSVCGPCPEGDSVSCIAVSARDLKGSFSSADLVHVEETNTLESCP